MFDMLPAFSELTEEERLAKLKKAYEFILDHADDYWFDPVWDFLYQEITFEDFKESADHFDLDSEESMIKYFRVWSERRWKLKSFF